MQSDNTQANFEVFKYLVEDRKANVKTTTKFKRNLLHIAVIQKQPKILQYIFEHQDLFGDLNLFNQPDLKGNTPFELLEQLNILHHDNQDVQLMSKLFLEYLGLDPKFKMHTSIPVQYDN